MAGKGIIIQIQGDGTGAQEALRQIEAKMQETAERGKAAGETLAGSMREFQESITLMRDAFLLDRAYEAISGMIEKTVDLGMELGHLSKQTGISVQDLSVLRFASQETGVEFDTLTKGFKKLASGIFDWEHGTKSAGYAFADLGISLKDVQAKGQDMYAILAMVADKFKDMPDGPEKSAIATKLFGRAGVELIPILDQGSAAISEYRTKAEELGVELNSSMVEKMEEVHRKSAEMKAAFQGLALELTSVFAPALQNAAEAMTGFLEEMRISPLQTLKGMIGSYLGGTIGTKMEFDAALKLSAPAAPEGSDIDRLRQYFYKKTAPTPKTPEQIAAEAKAAAAAAKVAAEEETHDDTFSKAQVKAELEQLERAGAARLQLAEKIDSTLLGEAKSAASVRMAQLEADHQTGLISEQEYLQKKLELNEQMLDRERTALVDKQRLIRGAITAEGMDDTPRKIELRAQLLEIEAQLKELSDGRRKDEIETAAAMERQRQEAVAQFLRASQENADAIARGNIHGQGNKWNADAARQSAQTISGFMDQLSSQAIEGRVNFREMVDSVIMDIERLALKVMEERAIIPMMNALFGVAGGAGASMLGPQTSSPDLSGISIPYMANGGMLNAGDWAVVGDGKNGDMSNAELFAPGGPGTVLPHSVLEGIAASRAGGVVGAAPNVSVNVINNSSANVSASPAGVSYDAAAKQFVIHTVLEDMNQGGALAGAMSGFAPK